MAGWMKTPLGTEVDIGAGHIVLDGFPAPACSSMLAAAVDDVRIHKCCVRIIPRILTTDP